MLDDFNVNIQLFLEEWNQFTKLVDINKLQVIAAGAQWSDCIAELLNSLVDPMVIIACPIEVSVKHKVQIVSNIFYLH